MEDDRCGLEVLKPKTTNEISSSTVMVVVTAWTSPEKRMLRRWAMVAPATRRKAMMCSALLGITCRNGGKGLANVLAKGEGADGYRRGEADDDRSQPGAETDDRMIDAGEEIVFASGLGQSRGQFRIAERSAEGEDTADNPEHDDGENAVAEQGGAVGGKTENLKLRAVKTPVPIMLETDQRGCWPGRNGLFCGVRFHGEGRKKMPSRQVHFKL